MKHVILVNPVSGNKKGEKYGTNIQKLLKKYHIQAEMVLSEYPKHLTKVAHDMANTQTCRFYSVGGDGTLNEIVSGIVGTNSEIVVIPSGTGNDFVKSISDYRSMRKIVINAIDTKSSKVDVLKIGRHGYCINILNVGFDSMVAKNVDKFRKVPFISGKMKYNLAIFYTLLSNKNFKLKIKMDNMAIKGRFTLTAIANGKYYGGGICPCPDANVSDGILDTCTVGPTEVIKKIFLLPKYQKGKHTDHPLVHIKKAKDVRIVSTRKFPVSIDGEIIYSNRLHIQVLPQAVNIVKIKKK